MSRRRVRGLGGVVLALGSFVLLVGGAAALSLATAPAHASKPPITQAERTACANVLPVSPNESEAFAVTTGWIDEMERSGNDVLAKVGRQWLTLKNGESDDVSGNLMAEAAAECNRIGVPPGGG